MTSEQRRVSTSATLSSGLNTQNELLHEIAQLRSQLAQSSQQLERAQAAGYVEDEHSNRSKSRSRTPSGDDDAGSTKLQVSSTNSRSRRVTMPALGGGAIKVGNGVVGGRHSYNNSDTQGVVLPRQSIQRRSSSINPGNRTPPHSAGGIGGGQHQQQHQHHHPSSRPSSRAQHHIHNNQHSTPRSVSSLGYYAGAPPSSLATPTSASTPVFNLKRDPAYEDLAVMGAASPAGAAFHHMNTKALGIGHTSTTTTTLASPPPHPRRRSMSVTTNNSSNNGTPVSHTKIPMPVIAKGSVGTATTLAGGGNSPKSPLSANGDRDRSTFDSPVPLSSQRQRQRSNASSGSGSGGVPENVLRDSTNVIMARDYAGDNHQQHRQNKEQQQKKSPLSIRDSTNGLPKMSPSSTTDQLQSLSPGPLSPHFGSSLSDSEEQSPLYATEDGTRLGVRTGSKSSAGMSRGGSSPFFGGSAGFTERHAARIASSQSGTSKVIMTLQTDLTNSRAQLESTRTQLRASARAVESLTRAIEDLKEGKERSRLELQAMSTTLSRRERMLEETLSRARSAESSNRSLEDEKKLHYGECTKKIKDLELRCREAEERRGKAESEYQALRSAAAGLGDGFKKEIKMLKKELNTARLKGEQERNDAKTRQQSVTKLLSTRTAAKEDVEEALKDLSIWQEATTRQYQSTIAALAKQNDNTQKENEVLARRTKEVLDELQQYKNAMRAYDDKLRQSQQG